MLSHWLARTLRHSLTDLPCARVSLLACVMCHVHRCLAGKQPNKLSFGATESLLCLWIRTMLLKLLNQVGPTCIKSWSQSELIFVTEHNAGCRPWNCPNGKLKSFCTEAHWERLCFNHCKKCVRGWPSATNCCKMKWDLMSLKQWKLSSRHFSRTMHKDNAFQNELHCILCTKTAMMSTKLFVVNPFKNLGCNRFVVSKCRHLQFGAKNSLSITAIWLNKFGMHFWSLG